MVNIDTVRTELDTVPCPVCHHVEWDLIYRCDLDYKGCLYDAKCGHCGYDMEVSEGGEFMENQYTDDVARIHESGCPSCHSKDINIHYRCELEDKSCLYISVCNRCHTVSRIENV